MLKSPTIYGFPELFLWFPVDNLLSILPSCCNCVINKDKYVSEISSGPVSNEFKLNHWNPSFLTASQCSLKLHI